MFERVMRYEELVELARLCANNARIASTTDVAAVLWRIAREYQEKAAKLDGDKLPDIGKPPQWFVG
jgi:hypothetical protein